MSVKMKVLSILENNRDKYISGQYMAECLGVSRSAIWKSIKCLEKEHHKIKAITNKGYKLEEKSDIISEQGIKAYLNNEYKDIKIIYHDVTTSTNDIAKKCIINDNVDKLLVVADKQTAGRGRFGRNFYSPEQTGIYMSIVIEPKIYISDISIITIMTALAVCDAIEKFTDSKTEIKWVNDIFVNNKKVCGILTEAISNFENGIVDYVIIGIGINVSTKEFPSSISSIAGSISYETINRNKMIGYIINKLFEYQADIDKQKLIYEYKKKMFILNKKITYYKNNEQYIGTAVDILENGELLIKNSLGDLQVLYSGEVTLSE